MIPKPTNEDFLRAKAAYESQSGADRVSFSNIRLREEGSPWRAVEELPHENLLLRLADDSVKIIPIKEVWLGSVAGKTVFRILVTSYSLIPFVATVYFTIHLRLPVLLLGILFQLIAIPYVGVPKNSILREVLGGAAIISALVLGLQSVPTILLGIPAFAACAYHYADSFKNWAYINEIMHSEERFNYEVASSTILVQIDTSRNMPPEDLEV